MTLDLLFLAVDLATYMTHFQWDMAKYPIKQSLRNISEQIAKVSTMIRVIVMHETRFVLKSGGDIFENCKLKYFDTFLRGIISRG